MKTIYFVLVFFLLSTCLYSTIINVPSDQPTIQAGIDATADGDTVLVADGTYYENINFNGRAITVASNFLINADTLHVENTLINGSQHEYPDFGSCVVFLSGEDTTSVLTGITLTEGTGANIEQGLLAGGGICCYESSPSLENVIISGNSALGGGGIYCWYNSSPSLVNVTVSDNSAVWGGGGIHCEYNSNPSLLNVTVTGNSAGRSGGGINCEYNSSPCFDPINRCNVYLNSAGVGCDLYAGNCDNIDVIVDTFTVLQPDDFFVYPIDNFSFDIINAKVEPIAQDLFVSPTGSDENSGLTADDPLLTIHWALVKILPESTNIHSIHISNGIYSPSTNGEMFPINCRSYISLNGEEEILTILDGEELSGILYCQGDNDLSIMNMTIQNGYSHLVGGGICCNNSSPKLVNVTIFNNVAYGTAFPYSFGGGIYCYSSNPSLVNVIITGNNAWIGGGIDCWDSNPSLVNVTITDNSAAESGGGIFCEYNSNPELLNCILWSNIPQEIYFREDYDPNSITISYSDIEGGEAGIVTNNNGTVNWLEGNIDEGPLFVGTGVFPYSLMEDSPCIDTGNPDPIYYDPEDPSNPDYALYPAMGTIINDMGAYGGPNTIGWPPVGVEDNVIVHTPEVFLHQNYPNPFNPTTTINYSLKENSKVSLNVYNIKGQKVKQLVRDQLSVGQHSVIWNGKDKSGKSVSSGIYLYKMKTDNHEEAKKMILMK